MVSLCKEITVAFVAAVPVPAALGPVADRAPRADRRSPISGETLMTYLTDVVNPIEDGFCRC